MNPRVFAPDASASLVGGKVPPVETRFVMFTMT